MNKKIIKVYFKEFIKQHKEFIEKINLLESTGILKISNDKFIELNKRLRKISSHRRLAVIEKLTRDSMEFKLRQQKHNEKEVNEIIRIIINNWNKIVESGKEYTLHHLFDMSNKHWENKRKKLENLIAEGKLERKKSWQIISGASKIVTAGSLFAIDVTLIERSKMPDELALTSFMGTATFFWCGIDDIANAIIS